VIVSPHGADEQVEPFIRSPFRRDALEDLANAPLVALATRLRDLIDNANGPDKKDGKDGTTEGSITTGDPHMVVSVLRIKDDKMQTEKYKEATDGSMGSEGKESCDVRQSTSVFGRIELIDVEQLRAVEELQATRLGITVRRGGPII
jgi:hypothetical protein